MIIEPESPWQNSEPNLENILKELIAREPIFHRPEWGTRRSDYKNMIVDDYWEVGASGKRYGTQFVLDTLEARQHNPEPDHWKTSEFHCRKLAENLFLLTYTLHQGENYERETRRATIWAKFADGWKIVYHQGTIVKGE